MSLIINPGSGPVGGASEEEAVANIHAFIDDLIEQGHAAALGAYGDEDDGRWPFDIVVDGDGHDIEMPGIPLAQVRYLGRDDQDIWDFPRLYVDGSSWVWCFALSAASKGATG